MLISFGADPSVKDSNGNTALHLAVLHGNLDCMKVILNISNTKSLPLDDFNDEGKCMFDLYLENCSLFMTISGRCPVVYRKVKVQPTFGSSNLQGSSFAMTCPWNLQALLHIHKHSEILHSTPAHPIFYRLL
jgi:ankyrin repeat protein